MIGDNGEYKHFRIGIRGHPMFSERERTNMGQLDIPGMSFAVC